MLWPRFHYTKLILPFVIITAIAVRLYNFPAWFGFDYDQEVNAWIAKTILVDHKPVLIGPETSVGGMFMGPFFNYLITLFFAIGRMNPAWTILLNTILSLATLLAFYYVTAKIFNDRAAKIAVVFYSFSAMIIGYDRVLWNPTPIPLVSLLLFYFLYRFLDKGNHKDLLLATVFLGLMFHLHFQAIIITAVFCLAILLFRKSALLQIKSYLVIAGTLLLFLSPLILFDLRHDFLNFRHLLQFFSSRSSPAGGFDPVTPLYVFFVIIISLRDLIYNNSSRAIHIISQAALVLPLAAFAYLLTNLRHNFYRLSLIAVLVNILAFTLYKGPLPPQYYLLFLYPLFILLISDALGKLAARSNILSLAVSVLLFAFALFNVWQIKDEKSDLSLKNKHQAVAFIANQTQGKSFKVDTIALPGLNTGFKYLFWLEGKNPSYDHLVKTEKAYKLVVPARLARPEELSAQFGSIGVVEFTP